MSRLRVLALIGVVATVSVVVTRPSAPAKLDVELSTWAKHPTTPFVRTLIRVQPGTAAQVAWRLAYGSRHPALEIEPDVLFADLTPAGLSAANFDGAVVGLSTDSPVTSTAMASRTLATQRSGIAQSRVR